MAWRCRFLVHPTHWLISTQNVTISFLPNMRSQMREKANPMVDESSSSSYLPSAFLRRGQGVTRAVSAREGLLSCALVCVSAVVLPRRRTARDFSVSGGDPSLEARRLARRSVGSQRAT